MRNHTSKKWFSGLILAAGLIGFGSLADAAPTQVEGATGGGIVPFALLPPSTPTGFFTNIFTNDFNIFSVGGSAELFDRVEISYTRQIVELGSTNTERFLKTNFNQDNSVNIDVVGAKLKLLDMSEGWIPTVSLGLMYKNSDVEDSVRAALEDRDGNSIDDDGFDIYAAATKIFPVGKYKALANVVIRGTQANQIGVLGYGDEWSVVPEFTLGLFLRDDLAFGAEYRVKPNELRLRGGPNVEEDDWWDVWMAWFPNERLNLTVAYANLGDILAEVADAGAASLGTPGGQPQLTSEGEDQQGLYLSFQLNFDLLDL